MKLQHFCGSRLLRAVSILLFSAILVPQAAAQQTAWAPGNTFSDNTLRSTAPLLPVTKTKGLPAGKVKLGEILFFDQRLSKDGNLSCNSCHNLTNGGADSEALSAAANGGKTRRNTPSIFNSALNPYFSWYGRHITLETQIESQITANRVMGGRWASVIDRLAKDESLAGMFEESYGGGVSRDSIVDALSHFVRSLNTGDSLFDQFLAGDANALTRAQKRGHRLFVSLGCIACHQGRNVGGNIFQRIGIFEDYYGDGHADVSDTGRYEITGREKDRLVFRVPSLRNVARTAPYFHDGSVRTLEKAIMLMARYQMGRDLDEDEVADIAAFLYSMSSADWTAGR